MNILITGSTGFIGKALTLHLLKKNHNLTLLCRNPKSTLSYFNTQHETNDLKQDFSLFNGKTLNLNLKIYPWDIEKNLLPPEDAFKGLSAVIHLAGFPIAKKRWNRNVMKKIYDSRIKGTRLLIQGLKKYEKNKRHSIKTFICASAIGYYGKNRTNEKITESFSGNHEKNDFLSHVCMDWESEVKQGCKGLINPFRKIFIRISNVLGSSGGIIEKLYPLFKRNLGGRLGSGQQFMSWIHIEDLIHMIEFCLENQEIDGPINGSSPHPVTNLEFTKTFGQVLGKKTYFRVPSFALSLATGKIAEYILASLRVYPNEIQKFKFQFKYPHLKEALESLQKT